MIGLVSIYYMRVFVCEQKKINLANEESNLPQVVVTDVILNK